jgi:hypothetical protein
MRLSSELGLLLMHDKDVSKLLSDSAKEDMNKHLDEFNKIAVQYHSKFVQMKLD